jgi:putative membrane protein
VDFTNQLASKYQSLFTLPNKKILIAELIIISTFVGFLAHLIAMNPYGNFFGIIDGIVSISLGSIICALIINKIAENMGLLTFRRTIALTVVAIVLLAFGLIIGASISRFLHNPMILERAYFLTCGIMVTFQFLVLSVASELKRLRLFLTSLLQPCVILALHSLLVIASGYFNAHFVTYFIAFFLMTIISYILAKWYYFSIEKIGKRLMGYGSVSLFKAFINALMFDRNDRLENVLKTMAIRQNVEVRTLAFKCNTLLGLIVAPMIHPGPFRNVGGSTLPTKIAKVLLNKQVLPLIYHTPTTHDKDLVLTEDCNRVIQSITATRDWTGVSSASLPIAKKIGNVTVTCQIFDETPLIVITRSPLSTEDLPEKIHTLCMEIIKENGYSDGIVVDAHNSMEKIYTEFTEQDESDLKAILVEVLSETKKSIGMKLEAGLVNAKINKYTKKEGVGDGGIMALVTLVSGVKTAYVSIDGNNMVSGLREKIQVELKQAGYDISEITTTDTHTVTGRTGGEGYAILGKAIPGEFISEKVVKAVKEADSKKCECLVKFSKRSIPDVYLLGKSGIERLWQVTDRSIIVAKKNVIILGLLLIVSAIILYGII